MARGFKNSTKNVFRKMNTISIVIAILTIIMGTVLLFLPEQSAKLVGILVGLVILCTGINMAYRYFKRDGAKIFGLNLTFGILFMVLGALLIIYPYTVSQFVTICLGLAIIVNGATKINNAIWLKRGSEQSWLNTLASGVLLLVIGLLVLFNPFANLTLTRLAGAFITICGVLDLVDAITFSLRSEEITEIFW